MGQAAAPGASDLHDSGVLRADALHLKSGVVPLDAATSAARAGIAPLAAPGVYVVQLDGPLTPARLEALGAVGLHLGQYLPVHAYIVRLPAGFDVPRAVGGLPFVRWVGPFRNEWKLSPEIGSAAYTTPQRRAWRAELKSHLAVVFFDGTEVEAAAAELAALPVVEILNVETWAGGGQLELVMPTANYPLLADLAAVQWVEECVEFEPRNDTNNWIMQSNVPGSTPLWDHGLHGEGQIAGLIDTGIAWQTHCSLRDPEGDPIGPLHRKVVSFFGDDFPDAHGTHVAATLLGDEQPTNGTTQYRGMAYMARMAFINLTAVNTTNVYTRLDQNHDAGGRIHSNSWGNPAQSGYTVSVRDVDRFNYDNDEDLTVFSCTNSSSTVKILENAKNALAVSAAFDTPNQDSRCQGGFAPTFDGRRKPEVLAPGCGTLSADFLFACGFTSNTGTSMACPVISGLAILARQYYMDGYYPSGAPQSMDRFTPSGALIKATVINSAVDMTGVADYPSAMEGWGRPLLDDALYFPSDARKLLVLADIRNPGGMTTGQTHSYVFDVTDSAEPLKVTLVWTEKEASVNANPAYINDLNLVVTAPGASVYLGNNFAGGQSAAGGSADFRNNVEQVLRYTPALGRYTVDIAALAVNTTAPQGYALIVTGGVMLPIVCDKGDLNGDGLVDGDDANPFVAAVIAGAGTPEQLCAADMNDDGTRDGADVSAFVGCLVAGGCP